MDYSKLADVLTSLLGTNFYVCFNPEILDFTNRNYIPEMEIFSQSGSVKILLDDESLKVLLPMLRLSVFGKGNKIITWNWKNFISFILFRTGKTYPIDGAIIDLKIIETYSGLNLNSPKTLAEGMHRLKDLISTGVWKEVEGIYRKLHLPLMTTVIPHLETVGILNGELKCKVHAYYEINGQDNGRLRCSGDYLHGYVPHAMNPELRKSLSPCGFGNLFMVFDYRGMEVFMLSWMSKDPLLTELCREQDVYIALYEKIIGKKSLDKNDREIAKKFFLPVIYGQSAYSLSQRCNISLDVAESIVGRIFTLFPVALAFIESYQKQLKELGYAKDIFGKRRTFKEGKEYSVRNFAIQSPASVVCLEKLNHLYFALKDKADIAYNIHDGYALYVNKDNWKIIAKLGRDILTSDSDFCPGLKLRVTCRAGRNLDDLKLLRI